MWHLAGKFLDLIPEELKLHSLVYVKGGSATVVVPQVVLHELDRVGWVRDEHLGEHRLENIVDLGLDVCSVLYLL